MVKVHVYIKDLSVQVVFMPFIRICLMLQVGDYVLVRVINTETEDEVYIPGIVQVTPRRIADSAKFYTILTYNNQRVSIQQAVQSCELASPMQQSQLFFSAECGKSVFISSSVKSSVY